MTAVYDQSGAMLAVLDYADTVAYQLPHNDLWTASFRLPSSDPKNAFCLMHNLVKLEDGSRDIGLYRIVGVPDDAMTGFGGYVEYSCEHVMATLLDDILFGYHEIGGEAMDTGSVIRYILSQQETPRWQLGACEFADNFAYKFENTTLLTAFLSLGEVLLEPFSWEFDTSTSPWTVNLRRASMEPSCGIYYQRNLREIHRSVDASTLVTRLYLLGYGEGVNQLTIKDINGGLPYIDADTIGLYGTKASVFVDRRYEDAAALKARGEALLESLKVPYTTYTASAIDLVQLTGDDWDRFMPGKVVHVLDGEDNVEFVARIVNIGKNDVNGRRGDVEIVIANSVRDMADSINTLADRQGINELYSQGATNLYAQQFADNADKAHPAMMRVFVPQGCVRINQMLLSYQTAPFRAYETAAASGGETERTSGAGGSATVSEPQRVLTTEATTGAAYGAYANGSLFTSYPYSGGSRTDVTGTEDGSGGAHSHGMRHQHEFIHTHGVVAVVTIPAMTINVPSHSHQITLDPHTHGITYGIYEGGEADHVVVKVDGAMVDGIDATSVDELDIAAYLETDDEGKIKRGAWHTVELVPDKLTRIEANLFVQTFIQSIGGGDY